MEALHPIFKWLHIIAGIIWIGLLYFFNWINGHVVATMDADSKQKVVPELMPRALYFFRWGAAWTWVTGVVLLYVVFWDGALLMGTSAGNLMFEAGTEVTSLAHVMLLVTFVAAFLYDALYKSGLIKDVRLITIVSFLLIAGVVYLMKFGAGFSYRAFNIHLGALLGTNMAFNVWYRIWPAQQRIIAAIKKGAAPDPDDAGLAGLRSKHNTYMSFPLIWTMINQHTTPFAGGQFGITDSTNWLVLMIMVALGWHIVWQIYKKSGTISVDILSLDSRKSSNDDTLLRNIGIFTAILFSLSFFLPFINIGNEGLSLWTASTKFDNTDWIGVLALIIGSLILILNNEKKVAAALTGIGILFPLYRFYKINDIDVVLPEGYEAFEPSFGIGGYLIIIGALIQLYASLKSEAENNIDNSKVEASLNNDETASSTEAITNEPDSGDVTE